MTIQVTGRNIETGTALQDYIEAKIGEVLDKYIGPEIGGHVRVEKERGLFRTSCSVQLRTGLLVEAHGEAADAYGSADIAIERLDKRVRRYKRRLKNHHLGSGTGTSWPEATAADRVVGVSDEPVEHGSGADDHAAPLIVAETTRVLKELPVSAAVMQLDLTDEPFLLFKNAATGSLNLVYRRGDGNIGWVDPQP